MDLDNLRYALLLVTLYIFYHYFYFILYVSFGIIIISGMIAFYLSKRISKLHPDQQERVMAQINLILNRALTERRALLNDFTYLYLLFSE